EPRALFRSTRCAAIPNAALHRESGKLHLPVLSAARGPATNPPAPLPRLPESVDRAKTRSSASSATLSRDPKRHSSPLVVLCALRHNCLFVNDIRTGTRAHFQVLRASDQSVILAAGNFTPILSTALCRCPRVSAKGARHAPYPCTARILRGGTPSVALRAPSAQAVRVAT